MPISLVAALAANRAIGFRRQLLWHLPEDLHRFKALTLGHAVVMGRKTFESLPHGALPHRRNIVLSRSVPSLPGCEVYASLEAALAACRGENEVMVIGGESLYRQTLPLAHRLYLTHVDAEPALADAWFPEIAAADWRIVRREPHPGFTFVDYERV